MINIKIFLASPSDVGEERKIAKEVVEELNKSMGRKMGFFLDLCGWEDLSPTSGRPQEIINQELQSSDLFVGVMWKRWGSPSGNGEFSSGFEEEFTIATSLKENGGKLQDIKLFFREIDSGLKEDPGEQLKKVMEFQTNISESKKFLYSSYKNILEWERGFRTCLTDYILKKYEKNDVTNLSSTILGKEKEGYSQTGNDQSNLQETIKEIINTPGIDVEIESLKTLEKARLYLFASSLFYEENLDEEVLGAREIQKVYIYRKGITSREAEQKLILRTLMEDKFEVKTGWYFLKSIDHDIKNVLTELSLNDPSEELRIQTIKHLTNIATYTDLSSFSKKFEECSKKEQLAILSMFQGLGKSEDLEFLDTILRNNSSNDISKAAWTAKYQILFKEDQCKAIHFLKDSPQDSRGTKIPVLADIQQLNDEDLIKSLISDSDKEIRITALQKIIENIDEESLRALTNDREFEIRAITLLELVKRGHFVDYNSIRKILSVKDKEDAIKTFIASLDAETTERYYEPLIVEYYKTLSYEELDNKLGRIQADNTYIYQSLIETYFDKFQETLYKDIEEDFMRLKEIYLTDMEILQSKLLEIDAAKIAPELTSDINKPVTKELEEFINRSLLYSTSKAISKRPERVEINLARLIAHKPMGYFKNRIIQNLLETFHNHGTLQDIPLLMEFFKDPNIDRNITNRIVEIMLKINNDREFLVQLLDTNNVSVLQRVLKFLLKNPDESLLENIKALLYNQDQDIRILALSYLLQVLCKNDLEELLHNYPTGGQYYYFNVTCWLDRFLYAPDELKEYYKNQIFKKLQ